MSGNETNTMGGVEAERDTGRGWKALTERKHLRESRKPKKSNISTVLRLTGNTLYNVV